MTDQLYWHFTNGLQLRDGQALECKTYTLPGEPRMCDYGYHASKKALDALRYAPGFHISRVTLGGTVMHESDKSVATERTVLAHADAKAVILEWARWVALDVAHLWNMPPVVKEFLETGRNAPADAADAGAYAAAAAAAAAYAFAADDAADAYAYAYNAARAAAKDKYNTEFERRLNVLLNAQQETKP